MGSVAMVLWAIVFSLGVVFPSENFRQGLLGQGTTGSLSWAPINLFLFLLTYTVSNAAILCCLSGLLGELGRRIQIAGDFHAGPRLRGDYFAAILRAFLCYLGILTGFVVVGTGINLLVAPSPESYVRLAAIVSLAGFLFGFNRNVFRLVMDRLLGKAVPHEGDLHGGKPTTSEADPTKSNPHLDGKPLTRSHSSASSPTP